MCLEAMNLLVVVFCKFFIRQHNLSLMKINRYKVVKELKKYANSLDDDDDDGGGGGGGGGGGLAHYVCCYCSRNDKLICHVAQVEMQNETRVHQLSNDLNPLFRFITKSVFLVHFDI
ncbi:hypothetical protein GQX74_010281 [Glossina fuscipes]|nr:hypothetical protein GQX74_010281 [Glossina fuscipes]